MQSEPAIAKLIEIEHILSKQTKELRLIASDLRSPFIELAWPLAGGLRFRKGSGLGVGEAKQWRISKRGREALGLPLARMPRVREAKEKPLPKTDPRQAIMPGCTRE